MKLQLNDNPVFDIEPITTYDNWYIYQYQFMYRKLKNGSEQFKNIQLNEPYILLPNNIFTRFIRRILC